MLFRQKRVSLAVFNSKLFTHHLYNDVRNSYSNLRTNSFNQSL